MSPEVKARATYVILGTVYFVGGLENGVSVTRGWLHWRQQREAPDHVVGLVVAAYSVASFLVAPCVGRWVDKPGRSRAVVVTGACLHIVGAVLEIFLTDQWINILARFISGLGGGIDAVVLSEMSRYTLYRHRTSNIALLVGARLLGYLLVPGLDALLWPKILTHIQLPERKTAASGLSLAVLWAVVLLVTIFFYTELCQVQPIYQFSRNPERPSSHKHSSPATSIHIAGTVRSSLGDDYEVIQNDASYSSSLPISIPASITSSQCSESASQQMLAKSSEMIEEAEKYIQRMAEQSYSATRQTKTFYIDQCQGEDNTSQGVVSEGSEGDQMSTSFNHEEGKRKPLDSRREVGGVEGEAAEDSITILSGAFDHNSYVKRSGFLPRRLHNGESVLYIMYEEFVRPEVISLLAVIMAGTFAHLCFQMIIIPVIHTLLTDKEFYDVILFILAFVLLVAECLTVWWCNPQRRTVHLMVVGACVLIVGGIVFMTCLDHMETNEERYIANMIQIAVCVGLYITGLLLLLICATSAFTLLSESHLGLSQGVYHSTLSLAAIFAPLWIEGTWMRTYLLNGVVIGLLTITLILVLPSLKSLASYYPKTQSSTSRESLRSGHTTLKQSSNERQRLLP